MIRQCAWCNKIMGHKGTKQGITHGICPTCLKKMTAELKKKKEK